MDRFNDLKFVRFDKNLRKILTNKKFLLLFVSLAYNILIGNIKIKNKKKIQKHKYFLTRLASLEANFEEKVRLIKKYSQKKLKEVLSLLLDCAKNNGKICIDSN